MKMRRIAAAAAVLGIAASMAAMVPMSAGAADTYEPVYGGEFKFGKYLVMENYASVPNVSFNFKVAPCDDLTAPADSAFTVFKGPDGIKFKADTTQNVTMTEGADLNAKVSFFADDETLPESSRGVKTISFITDDSKEDEKFAEKTMTLDLSAVKFSQPGVYRYVITETNAEDVAGVNPDTDNTRYLDYYVTADDDGKLRVEGHVFYVNSNKKSTGFTNQYITDNLVFEKKVTGNQGSKDKHFKIRVQLLNNDDLTVSDNDVFKVIGEFEKAPAKTDSTIYTADAMKTANNITQLTYADLKAGHDFYLCSGHNIEIKGIPHGLGYKITEYQENYAPSVSFSSSSDKKTNDKTGDGTDIAGTEVKGATTAENTFSISDSFLKNNTDVTFTNELKGVIPTGILMSAAGPAVIAAIGIAGIIAGGFYLNKKKSEEE